MKKFALIFIVLAFSHSYLLAQKPEGQQYDKEKLEAARVAFVTNRLDLKADQAEKFWPLFNQYNEDRGKLMDRISAINRSSSQEITDAKAKEMIQERLSLQQQLLDKEKIFMEEVTKAITPVQAIKLGGVNREFTRQVYRMHKGGEKGSRN
ncbi:hypothetical protein [Aquiflexum sp.]|uniref:hypothetical protein n=1 Tax=Aquiflexum sp. TaxID=1872584 RepID=UPI0035944F09